MNEPTRHREHREHEEHREYLGRSDRIDRRPRRGNGSARRGGTGRALLLGAGLVGGALLMNRFRGRGQGRSHQEGWTGNEGGSMRGRRHRQEGSYEAKRKTLIAWLNDAYAMERALAQTLKGHANDAKSDPVISQRLRSHAEESKHHADLVERAIERLGGSVSNLKSGMSSVMGTVQGMAMMPAKDSTIKHLLEGAAAEKLEIASYRSIITAAEEIGDHETARTAREILESEERMAQWIDEQLPHAIREQLAHAT